MKGESVLRLEGVVTEQAHLSILGSLPHVGSTESLDMEFRLNRDLRFPPGKSMEDADEVQVALGCSLNGESEAAARAQGCPLWAHVQVVGHFIVENVPIHEREQMLLVNAVAIIFPYLRATLASLTSMCGLPAVTLPVFNVAAAFEDQVEEIRSLEEQ